MNGTGTAISEITKAFILIGDHWGWGAALVIASVIGLIIYHILKIQKRKNDMKKFDVNTCPAHASIIKNIDDIKIKQNKNDKSIETILTSISEIRTKLTSLEEVLKTHTKDISDNDADIKEVKVSIEVFTKTLDMINSSLASLEDKLFKLVLRGGK